MNLLQTSQTDVPLLEKLEFGHVTSQSVNFLIFPFFASLTQTLFDSLDMRMVLDLRDIFIVDNPGQLIALILEEILLNKLLAILVLRQ